jgi:predicted nucleic-acid-binding Zn-ribbon protein
MLQNSSPREPISEGAQPVVIQRAGGHSHQWVSEGVQKNGLTAYVCKKCGYGLMIDETIDSLDNY